jgi:hypothetical protein
MARILVEPYYFKNLVFAVPFFCFAIVTYFTANGELKLIASSVITFILMIILGLIMMFLLFLFSFEAAISTTTDIGRYERVLKIMGYPNNASVEQFPEKIPEKARNISFHYHSAFLQGGESIGLKYEIDSAAIKINKKILSREAVWTGKFSDHNAEKHGILLGTLSEVGYTELPEDFVIYVLGSKPYHPGDWNHGELSLAAVSEPRNEIIFFAEEW